MSVNFRSKKDSIGSPGQIPGPTKHLARPTTHEELTAQREKITGMLNNSNVKLPDGGAKLKAKLVEIEEALKQYSLPKDISDKVSNMTLDDKPDVRTKTVLRDNTNPSPSSTNLLRAHPSKPESNQTIERSRTARLMSLEESMKLQESRQKDIEQANMKKRMQSIKQSVGQSSRRRVPDDQSMADDITATMNRLRLDPETRIPRPDDDGPSDYEGEDDDSDDDSDEEYESYEDEGFDEED